ncbi:MAG: hypothetical protein JKY81_12225 [Colwellia sp.]|nr:hypothetical protein [Colwellia sp.]
MLKINSIHVFFVCLFLLYGCGGSGEKSPTSVPTPIASSVQPQNNNNPLEFGATLSEQSLTAAIQTANWLIATATETSLDEAYWPKSNKDNSTSVGKEYGVSGVGHFFIRLYRLTNDSRYLEMAIKAGNYINNYYSTNINFSHDWLTGTSGSGIFLLDLYQETNNSSYLDTLIRAGNWLDSTKIDDSQNGSYWLHWPDNPKIYIGITHGNGGAGQFLMALHQQTQQISYLNSSISAYQWLQRQKFNIGSDAIAWKRLSYDDFYYNGWCSGAAGLVPLLKGLYQATADERYLDDIRQIGNGLIVAADSMTVGKAWARDRESAASYFTTYCQGTAGIVDSLFDIYEIIPEQKYRDLAFDGLAWLQSTAITHEDGGIYWKVSDGYPQLATGYLMGVSSVARVFARGYKITGNTEYLEVTKQASEALLRIANRPTNEQLNWYAEIKETSVSEQLNTVYSSWFSGAAGIGLYWIDVYDSVEAN